MLNQKILQRLFCLKVQREYQQYRQEEVGKSREEIFSLSYQHEQMRSIANCVQEISEDLPKEELKRLLLLPNILWGFYQDWLQTEDSSAMELRQSILQTITKTKDRRFQDEEACINNCYQP